MADVDRHEKVYTVPLLPRTGLKERERSVFTDFRSWVISQIKRLKPKANPLRGGGRVEP